MKTTSRRVGWIGVLIAAAVMTFGVTAFADGKGGKEGCGKRGEARFQKADKNSDGFLTAAEVGDEKWARIKVADANTDGKISQDEMKQAKADGKLKRHKGKKGKHKGGSEA